jgi:hypothetical protein
VVTIESRGYVVGNCHGNPPNIHNQAKQLCRPRRPFIGNGIDIFEKLYG